MRTLSPRTQAHATAVLVAAALAVVYAFPPGRYGFYPACPFLTWFGIECPGCGSTRALHALLHGEWAGALAFNPVFPFVFATVMAFAGAQYVHAMRHGRFFRCAMPNSVYWAATAAAAVFTFARNLL